MKFEKLYKFLFAFIFTLSFLKISAFATEILAHSDGKIQPIFRFSPFFKTGFGMFAFSILALLIVVSLIGFFTLLFIASIKECRHTLSCSQKYSRNIKIFFHVFLLGVAFFACAFGMDDYMPLVLAVILLITIAFYMIERKLIKTKKLKTIANISRFEENNFLMMTFILMVCALSYIVFLITRQIIGISHLTIYSIHEQFGFKLSLTTILGTVIWKSMKFLVFLVPNSNSKQMKVDINKCRRPFPKKGKNNEDIYAIPNNDESLLTILSRAFELKIFSICLILSLTFSIWHFSTPEMWMPSYLLFLRFLSIIGLCILAFNSKFKKNRPEYAYLYLFVSYAIFFITTVAYGV